MRCEDRRKGDFTNKRIVSGNQVQRVCIKDGGNFSFLIQTEEFLHQIQGGLPGTEAGTDEYRIRPPHIVRKLREVPRRIVIRGD